LRRNPLSLEAANEARSREKESRMAKVAHYRGYGFSLREIATKLEVSFSTVRDDIADLKREWKGQVEKIDLSEYVGAVVYDAQLRKRRANKIFLETTNPAVKLGCLKLMSDEDERTIRLLQSVGLLYKRPEGMSLQITAGKIQEAEDVLNGNGIRTADDLIAVLRDRTNAGPTNGKGTLGLLGPAGGVVSPVPDSED